MNIHIAIPGYERILNLINTIRHNYSSEIEFIIVSPDVFSGPAEEKIRSLEQEGLVDVFVGSGSAGRLL